MPSFGDLHAFAESLRLEILNGFPASRFDALALRLFSLQYASNPAYRRLCDGAGRPPGKVASPVEIPCAPAIAFKELELSCIPGENRTHVFHSSGTTGHKPSRHFHHARSLSVYESALTAGFAHHVLASLQREETRCRIVSLTPPPAQAPHSSLVHMAATVMDRFGADGSGFLGAVSTDGAWELAPGRVEAFAATLQESDPRPVVLLGTAFSFVHLGDALERDGRRWVLPRGSRVMETGGYKGRSRELTPEALHAMITERLGVRPEYVVREYGMSELSSQAYDRVAGDAAVGGTFRFPPWVRALVTSPETGRECAPGEPGRLRLLDLANVYSVMGVQTEDRAVGGPDGFRLLGRAPASEPRGCSWMPA